MKDESVKSSTGLEPKLEVIEEALLQNVIGGTYDDPSCDHGDGSCYVCPDCTGSNA